MTVTDEMLDAGRRAWNEFAGKTDTIVGCYLAMRALEPAPRSDDARLTVARQWLPGNLSKGGGLAEHVLAALDAHDPLRNLSGDGVEAACRSVIEWHTPDKRGGSVLHGANDHQQILIEGLDGQVRVTWVKPSWSIGDCRRWAEMPTPPPWVASPQPDHAESLVAPDIWNPLEQCETPAVCRHQGMCEKFMAGKCGASAEPSVRAVLGALARIAMESETRDSMPREDVKVIAKAAGWKP